MKKYLFVFIISLFFLSIVRVNETFSFDKIATPVYGYNLFYDNYSKILFTDNGRGVYSLDLPDKGIKNFIDRDNWIYSIGSTGNDILLIYLDKACNFNLSILDNGKNEEIIYSSSAAEMMYYYPAMNPVSSKIALTEKIVSKDKTNLIVVDRLSKSKEIITDIYASLPIYSWNNTGKKLYYFNKNNEGNYFYFWDENTRRINTIKKINDVSLYYLYPYLIDGGYLLFLGEDDKSTPILGKLDIESSKIDLVHIDDKNYDVYMSIFFTPNNKFIYQTLLHKSNKSEYKVYLSDINFNSKLVYTDTCKSLCPIGYNNILDKFLFFRDEKAIISIKLNKPNAQRELIFAR